MTDELTADVYSLEPSESPLRDLVVALWGEERAQELELAMETGTSLPEWYLQEIERLSE